MAQRDGPGLGRRERVFINSLWTAAGCVVVGSLVRILASLLAHPELRITGVALIGVGVAVAVLAWVYDHLAARRAH